jgi:hypothetical protein
MVIITYSGIQIISMVWYIYGGYTTTNRTTRYGRLDVLESTNKTKRKKER